MKRVELTYAPYRLKLSKPFFTSRGAINERRGLILKLSNETGLSGIGEAAPYPEFGTESLSDTEKALENIKLNVKIEIDNIIESANETLASVNKYPSLRHGLEQALLNLVCKEKGITLNDLLKKNSLKILNVNAVLGFEPPAESGKAAKDYVRRGYSTLKLKLGRNSFEEDLQCIKAIKNAVKDKLKLRLDVNGKWNLTEAKQYIRELVNYEIEFIEQPVNQIDDFIELSKTTEIPVAVDESLRSVEEADNYIKKGAAGVLILKPMMIGGLLPTLRIMDKAEEMKIKTVISSSFESVVGRTYAVFIGSLVHENIAHGLSTAEYFQEDLMEDPYPVKDGKIFL